MMGLFRTVYDGTHYRISMGNIEDLENSSRALLIYTSHNPLSCDGTSPAYRVGKGLAIKGDYDIFFTTSNDPKLSEYVNRVVVGHKDIIKGLSGEVDHIPCRDTGRKLLTKLVDQVA
jgi:hypothetical protein